MRRHPALHELSRDHHRLLLLCRAIRWYSVQDRRAPTLGALVAVFLDLWRHLLAPHMAEEETLLFPLYAVHGGAEGEARVAQALAEHGALCEAAVALREQATTLNAGTVPLRLPHDDAFVVALIAFGAQLHMHVRFEERDLFQHLQTVVPAESLALLPPEFQHFRRATRPWR